MIPFDPGDIWSYSDGAGGGGGGGAVAVHRTHLFPGVPYPFLWLLGWLLR